MVAGSGNDDHEICKSLTCTNVKCTDMKDKKFAKEKAHAKKLIRQISLMDSTRNKLSSVLSGVLKNLRENGVYVDASNISGL